MKYRLSYYKCCWLRSTKLYRVEALKDFHDVKRGDVGGYIEKEENLSQEGNCWVYDNSCVFGDAHICDAGSTHHYAKAYDNAKISDFAALYDCSQASGRTKISGNVELHDNVQASGHTYISGYTKLYRYVHICNETTISGNTEISGHMSFCGCTELNNARIYGDFR